MSASCSLCRLHRWLGRLLVCSSRLHFHFLFLPDRARTILTPGKQAPFGTLYLVVFPSPPRRSFPTSVFLPWPNFLSPPISSEKQRSPAWTDRIQWSERTRPGWIRLVSYGSCMELNISDHKPVVRAPRAVLWAPFFFSLFFSRYSGGSLVDLN